jgi:uncharacterized membrane protein YciS (DUF1049 family)
MRFKAKLDWWFYTLIATFGAAIICMFVMFMINGSFDIVLHLWILFPAVLICGWLLFIGLKLNYTLTETSLIIKHGKFLSSQEILYENIKTIERLNSGRIMIKYLYRNRVLTGLLWVADREEFMKQVGARIARP